MQRGVTVTLPPEAQARLDQLGLNKDAAYDAGRSVQQRMNMLPQDTAGQIHQRLAAERDNHARQHNQLSRLWSSTNQLIMQLHLAPGQILAPVPPAGIKPPPGETAAEAIEKVRAQIGVLSQQIIAARRAPLRRQSKADALAKRLAGLALRARPRVNFDAAGNATITFTDEIAEMSSVLGLLALCFPQEITSAFIDGDAESEADPPNALTPADRDAAVAKLQSDLLALERIEAELLDMAGTVLPRHDMNPLAYLCVEITEAAAVAEQPAEASAA
jgi:hypothetical protein